MVALNHILGQAAHIAMGLHAVLGLQNVVIDGALSEEADLVANLAGLLLEHTDELGADDLTLLLRVSHALQFAKETLHGIHIYQVGIHLVFEYFDYALRFTFSHKAVIHMDTGQLPADCLNQKGRNNRTVHAS